ncbi:hypothetical protein DFH09DRAFT_1361718 [Mycena vulgaris]|nr:hypothetical protein DFH09DRAFT_1361718 [Mycena vulgaris]
MAATQAVFRIQELCNQILQHLSLDGLSRADLKSTALVCHTLCTSAQSQLFCHIVLDPLLLHWGRHDTMSSMVKTSTLAVRRLSAILTTSPHLRRCIHHLSVFAMAEILGPLSSIHLPALWSIHLNFLGLRQEEYNVMDWSRDWIALPSIREVQIANVGIRVDVDSLAALFETHSSRLDSVSFTGVHPTSPSFTASRPRERRAQIKRLKLNETNNLSDWLTSPSSPFDFAGLVDIEMTNRFQATALLQILNSARLTITRLEILNDFAFRVDLPDFPALTCLELCYSHIGSYSNYAVISTLNPRNCVEVLVLHVHVEAMTFTGRHTRHPLSAADALIANSTLPALRQVELRISGRSDDDLGFESNSVKSCFPQLDAKGLLVVTDSRSFI